MAEELDPVFYLGVLEDLLNARAPEALQEARAWLEGDCDYFSGSGIPYRVWIRSDHGAAFIGMLETACHERGLLSDPDAAPTPPAPLGPRSRISPLAERRA
jgi:hypothetical protein